MKGMMSNMRRKADKYGNIHFISLYGAILSRLAYNNDNTFLELYDKIFGPVIIPEILSGINKVSVNNLENILDDEKIFDLKDSSNQLSKYTYTFDGKLFIAFNEIQIPKNVNYITNEIKGTPEFVLKGQSPPPDTVKYISVGWSSYGEIFIVADKRMPTMIFVIFRGTYSAKTAALYSKPTSLVPLQIGCKKKEGFLYGIFKPSIEVIHTVLESITYLAKDFLKATTPNSVKVFTTGHSLGGAMCTNFAYLWSGIRNTPPYNTAPYNILSNKIICISLGSPRGLSTDVAQKFCDMVKKKEIIYLRVTTRGDPVTGLPMKSGYQHPCSTDPEMRETVVEACTANLTARGKINVKYDADLDCQSFKTRVYVPNMLSHTIYLNILFTSAVDIVNFLKGVGSSKEVLKTPRGSSACRLIVGLNTSPIQLRAGFFDLGLARDPVFKKKEKIGGPVNEDVMMSSIEFEHLIQKINNSKVLEGNLCPMSPPPDTSIINPFTSVTSKMPRLSCVNADEIPSIKAPITTKTDTIDTTDTSVTPAAGGKRKTRKTRKIRKTKKKMKSSRKSYNRRTCKRRR